MRLQRKETTAGERKRKRRFDDELAPVQSAANRSDMRARWPYPNGGGGSGAMVVDVLLARQQISPPSFLPQ